MKVHDRRKDKGRPPCPPRRAAKETAGEAPPRSTNYDVSLVVMLKNDGEKAIKATKGAVIVYNVFGDELTHLNIENAKTILPGKAVKEAGEWQIMGKHEALNAINGNGADTSKLTFAFSPKVILFADGSKFEQ